MEQYLVVHETVPYQPLSTKYRLQLILSLIQARSTANSKTPVGRLGVVKRAIVGLLHVMYIDYL